METTTAAEMRLFIIELLSYRARLLVAAGLFVVPVLTAIGRARTRNPPLL